MKKTNLLLTTAVAVLMLLNFSSMATVLRVNNNGSAYSTGVNVYSDLIVAIASASAGDTLYLEASSIPYGTSAQIHLNKQLTFIGPGYFLGGPTGNANLQANNISANIGQYIFFDTGSENSVMEGLELGTNATIIYIRASNITIKRNYFECRLFMDQTGTLSNITITQNYFPFDFDQVPSSVITSSTITNNYFGGSFSLSGTFLGPVAQNVFNSSGITFSGNDFYNNIIESGALASSGNDTTNVHNNVFTYPAPAFLTGSISNTFSFPANSLFIQSSSTDGNLQDSSACSACFTTGFNGYTIGVYGGPAGTQYIKSGIPEIPTIYLLNANPNILRGSTIPVTIHTRSNN